jgi:hypothetical protein
MIEEATSDGPPVDRLFLLSPDDHGDLLQRIRDEASVVLKTETETAESSTSR